MTTFVPNSHNKLISSTSFLHATLLVVDDADEEHGSALRGLVGGAGGDDDDDGTAEATGMAEGEPPRTPRGPAFQID